MLFRSAPQLSPRPPPSPTQSRRRNPGAHGRQQTDSALLTSPPRRSLSTYTSSTLGGADAAADAHAGTGASATQGRRRRRTTLDPVHSPPFPNPLSPPTGGGLSGFSIGLSPISPGFSIVPRERRRRATPGAGGSSIMGGSAILGSAGAGGEGAPTLEGEGAEGASTLRAPLKMRRVVSEGDADARERQRREGLPYGTDVEQGPGDGPGAVAGDEEGSGGDALRRAKGRWKWLRDVFAGTGR